MEKEVEIERFADQGRCIAHIDGRVVFVRFALPG
ncbi:MAG: TRAM domain-containing protein, partial [Bifidobacteriaceae bacterium]|nr:TRAM domain-containing protein [Bifidobacteriaceae bacterium]